MKKSTHLLTLAILLITGCLFSAHSQNAGINTTGAVPSTNAVLDLNTGNKYNMGLVIPHVTLGPSLSTFSPPMANAPTIKDTGMMVYNMNGLQPVGYYCWTGSAWVSVAGVSVVSSANNGLTLNGGTMQLGGINPLIANTDIISGGNDLSFTGSGKFQLGSPGSSTGTLGFYNVGSISEVGISAGLTTAPYNLILPTAQATSPGQVLTNNGAGQLSWTTSGTVTSVTANAPAYITGPATAPMVNVEGDLSGSDKGGVLYSTTPGNPAQFTPTGTPGFLLQSNGSLAPTWINPTTLYNADDGLIMSGTTVQLGGSPLTANTVIPSGGNNLAFTGTGDFQLGAAGASTGTLQFYNVATGNAVSISAGGTTAPYSLTLPTSQGAAGQLLTNNGAGVLSWTTNGTGTVTSVTGTAPINVSVASPNPVVSLQGTNGGVFYGTGAGSAVTAGGGQGTILYNSAANTVNWMPSGAAGSMMYNSAANTPAWLPATVNGDVLTLAGGVPTWTNPATVIGAANGLTMNGTNVQLGGANALTANTNLNSGGFNLDFTGGGTFEFGQAGGSTGSVEFYNGTNVNGVTITSGTTTAPYALTLPTAQATSAGQVLTNNGAGALSWTTPAGGTVTSVNANAPAYITGPANAPIVNVEGNVAGTDKGGVLYSTGSGTAAVFTPTGVAGDILQSNGTAAPTWVSAGTIIGADNGLTMVGNDVQLGGTLLANSTVNSGGFNFAFTGSGDFELGAAGSSTGTLDFYNVASGNAVGISAGNTTAAYNLTLPTAQATSAGQVLTNNGAGALSWTTPTSVTGADNGLSLVGGNIQLGGANPLLANTSIVSGGNNLAFTGTGDFQLGVSGGSTGTLQFFNVASGTGSVSISAGATGASYGLTLPTAQGAANTVLTNNGAGVLSWGTAAAGADNGLTMNGTNVQLGGANPLLANTSINSGGFNLDFTGGGNFQLGTASTSTGNLQFYNAGSANAIGIAAGATTAAYNLTLPLAQGAANTVLTNNGAGVLSWTTVGAVNSVTANAPAYITGPANAPVVNVEGNAAGTDKGGVLYSTTPGNAAVFTPTGTAGFLLQSNGTAAPTWVNPTTLFGADNGLTLVGTDAQLGGTLLANSTIASAGFNLAFTGTGAFELGAAGSSTGTLKLFNVASGNAIGISAGNTSAAYNLTLPTAQGAANTELINNGAGVLSWGTAVSGAANGLTMNGTNAQLGGANPLLANTSIISGGFNLAFTGTGAFVLGAAGSSTGTLQLYNVASGNAVSITAGNTSAPYTMSLPPAQGGANTVLTNNGAGALTWGTPAVGGAANGLTMNGTNVQLGGANALTANTSIISAGFNLSLTGTGSLGVGTAAPASTADIDGSYGVGTINMTPAAASTTPLTNAYSTILATPTAIATTYTLTLPSATANPRRIYTVVYFGSGLGTIDITSPVAGSIYANGAIVATYALTQGSVTLQSDGTNWQVISTTSTNANGTFVGIKYITVNTAATAFDPGTTSILVKVIGGGGAGGGGATNGACTLTDVAGSGGGAGGYVEGFLNSLSGSSTFAVTIGQGGVGNSACATLTGGNGGNTVLTIANPAATYTANGGTGGSNNESDNADSYKAGGAGGTATSTAPAGSYLTITGATGASSLISSAGTHVCASGTGAGSCFGPGGSSLTGREINEAGGAAVSYGAGGGGAIIAQESAAEAGGNGFQGVVIIYEYN